VGVLTVKDQHGRAGTAAAITGSGNSIVGGLLSPVPALLGGVSAASLGLVIVGTMVVAVTALWVIVRPSRVTALTRH
jgi:hypothetical protein